MRLSLDLLEIFHTLPADEQLRVKAELGKIWEDMEEDNCETEDGKYIVHEVQKHEYHRFNR